MLAAAAAAPCAPSDTKVVVVVANRLLLSDLRESGLPAIGKMLDEGAVGLVSPNGGGPKSEYAVLLTAAAGASCRGGPYVAGCYDAAEKLAGDQTAGAAHAVRTGAQAPRGSAVFLNHPQAVRENTSGRPVRLGMCGEALREAGKITCVVGSADIAPDTIDRSAAVLAMDSRGMADIGLLADGPSSGIPVFADADWLERAAVEGVSRADFAVIYYGDTVRLDSLRSAVADEVLPLRRAAVLRNLDSLLARLMDAQGWRDIRIVLVSFSPPSGGPWNQLTPVIVYPSRTAGLLTSPSTRTPGLIAASDFTPTVLDLMRVPAPAAMAARAATELASEDKMSVLGTMFERVKSKHEVARPVLWIIALIGASTFTTFAVGTAFSLRTPRWLLAVLRAGFLVGMSAPIGMLLAAAAPASVAGYAAGTVVVTAAVVAAALGVGRIASHRAAALGRVPPRAAPVVVVFALTVAAVLVDSAAGGVLCKFSVPSFYQLSGLRYYGIGNEYAGLVISMAALVALFVGPKHRRWAVFVLGALVVVFLGSGRLGANYGGTVTAVVTFGLVGMAVFRGGFGARHVAGCFLAAVALTASFAFTDWKLAGISGSHAGRVTEMVDKLGGNYVFSLIARKAQLNARIATCDTALRAYLAFMPFLALWFYGVQGKVRRVFADDKSVLAGLKGVLTGAVVALFVNDSGVVLANIMIAMIVVILLYSLLEEEMRSCPGS